jgi:hypothetical protein
MDQNVRIIRDESHPRQYWTGTRWSFDEEDAKLYTYREAFLNIARRAGVDC